VRVCVKYLARRRGEESVSVSVDLSHPFRFVHLFMSAHIIIEFVPADFPAVPGKAPVVDTEDTVCNARQCNARETKERKGRNAIADPKVLAKIEWRKESRVRARCGCRWTRCQVTYRPSCTDDKTAASMQLLLLEAEHDSLRLRRASVVLALYFAGLLTADRSCCRE
jgi:hypothetical protein